MPRHSSFCCNDRTIPCQACGELHDAATETLLHLGNSYCIECWRELAHGVIPPAWGPLEAETPDLDDNLVLLGRRDNIVRTMEDTR